MIIYKFTLKRDRKSNVEIHYVRHNSAEQAKTALAEHLGIDESIISFNPKNLPFKVREKVLNNVREDVDGKEVYYTLTLDFLVKNKKKVEDVKISEKEREEKRKQISNEFSLLDSIYNTLKYNIQALYREDEDVINKYNGDRVHACKTMRTQIIVNNLQEREFNSNISILDALDCYYSTLVK